ncbi:MAG TPA: CHAD domain-containing protein [Solirubrobacteraceae bacterium]|nr:CHAD domain-containing protein [Solirubrobacteraceae bacterium]
MKARRVKGLDAGAPLADNVERIVLVRLDELCSFVPRALDPSEVQALHDMRIAAKRLRYILETTADSCFGPYARAAARRARELQDLLGEVHDCDVTLPRVLGLLDDLRAADAAVVRAAAGDAEDLDPALSAAAPHAGAWRGLTTLAVHLRARRTLLFERFLELWRELEREGFRPRLEYAAGERPDAPARAALAQLDEAADAVARAAAQSSPPPEAA